MKRGAIRMTSTLMLTSIIGSLHAQEVMNVGNLFSPSGWMGDGEYGQEYVQFSGASKIGPHPSATSYSVGYTFGPKRWAGICWLNKAENWGDRIGLDLSTEQVTSLTFRAVGEAGGEVVEFKSGGLAHPSKPHRDSYSRTTARITLTREWKRYSIDLTQADLTSVIAGFCWVASADFNRGERIVFSIDDIRFVRGAEEAPSR